MPRPNKESRIAILALAASMLAIVLSQFHPLYTYLDRPRIAAGVSAAQFTHIFGSPQLYLFVQLRNEGRAAGTITRLDAYLQSADDDHLRLKMPSQSYFTIPTTTVVGQGPPPVPWAAVTLTPDLTWNNFVWLYNEPSDADRQKVAAFAQRAQQEMLSRATPSQGRISDALFSDIKTFVDHNLLPVRPGKYDLLLLVYDEKSRPLVTKGFSFVLTQQDMNTLSLTTEQYRSASPPGQPVLLTLKEITDPRILQKISKDAAT
jgi:hypothetical protein